ncbi:MAG: hypothetical protein MR215_00725 [Bacteroidales bacterium]|nr:hypothetical protein [Bacteroidales bacterium]
MKVKRVDVATVDGECRFIDCVAWFKNLKLNKEADIPFVLDYTKFQDKFAGGEFKVPVTKPCAVLLGVYNEKSDEMPNMQIIQCDKFDEKLVETLGAAENGLVVLS